MLMNKISYLLLFVFNFSALSWKVDKIRNFKIDYGYPNRTGTELELNWTRTAIELNWNCSPLKKLYIEPSLIIHIQEMKSMSPLLCVVFAVPFIYSYNYFIVVRFLLIFKWLNTSCWEKENQIMNWIQMK